MLCRSTSVFKGASQIYFLKLANSCLQTVGWLLGHLGFEKRLFLFPVFERISGDGSEVDGTTEIKN